MSPRYRQPLTIEHALLGFVRQQPLHGYELYQRLTAEETLGAVWQIKQSQFYALVTKLEQAGYLDSTLEQQEAHPPRKVLHLTDDGEAAFAAWVTSPVEHWEDVPQEFFARLYFARLAGEQSARLLVARQRDISRAWLDDLRAQFQAKTGCQSYGCLVLQWRMRQVEALLDWLDTSVARSTDPSFAAYPIAALNESAVPTLAQQFIGYVCSPAGQAVLTQHGFLGATKPQPQAAPVPDPSSVPASPVTADEAQQHLLTVFAASSLTDAFEAIGAAFAAANPGTAVQFVFGGSQHLANRIMQGAAADVFAPANHLQMEQVIHAGRVTSGSECVFAQNQLAIVTPENRPLPLATLRDLATPGLRIVLGSRATAIGQYALDMLAQAEQYGSLGVGDREALLQNVVCYEESVRAVLARVARGEADAGIVYTSDSYDIPGIVVSSLSAPLQKDTREADSQPPASAVSCMC